jgi:hypothetical protein
VKLWRRRLINFKRVERFNDEVYVFLAFTFGGEGRRVNVLLLTIATGVWEELSEPGS